jgi:Na+/proline symporter
MLTELPPMVFLLADGLGWLDYSVLVVYLIATVLIGVLTGSGEKTLDEYCLAGQRVPWWAACISIVATDLSGVSYMGVPAWMYTKDMKYFAGNLLMPLVMLAVVMIFLPIFFRVGVYTVYQYLEARFHPMARTVTAVLFLLRGFVWLGGAVYIPSLALAAFTHIPVPICILIVGVSTTLYTVFGGMHAVIWTDLMQFIVLVGGLVVMILIGMSDMSWDWAGVWNTAGSMTAPVTNTPHTTMVDWSFNFHTEATVWSLIFFFFIYNMGTYGTDQEVVQR